MSLLILSGSEKCGADTVKKTTVTTVKKTTTFSLKPIAKNKQTQPLKAAPVAPLKVEHSAEEIKKGKMLFVKATCWGCHPRGDNSINGDKPLKGPGFSRRYANDEDIVRMVRTGSVRRGMPPFGEDKLSSKDLAQIIIFIRSLSENHG